MGVIIHPCASNVALANMMRFYPKKWVSQLAFFIALILHQLHTGQLCHLASHGGDALGIFPRSAYGKVCNPQPLCLACPDPKLYQISSLASLCGVVVCRSNVFWKRMNCAWHTPLYPTPAELIVITRSALPILCLCMFLVNSAQAFGIGRTALKVDRCHHSHYQISR